MKMTIELDTAAYEKWQADTDHDDERIRDDIDEAVIRAIRRARQGLDRAGTIDPAYGGDVMGVWILR